MTLTWYCARTAPRREEQARKGLAELGLTAYLPLEAAWRGNGGKRGPRHRVELPLLPGYMFFAVRHGASVMTVERALFSTADLEALGRGELTKVIPRSVFEHKTVFDAVVSLDDVSEVVGGAGNPLPVQHRAIAIVQTVEGELRDEFERRAAKRENKRERPDEYIARLKAAPACERPLIVLEMLGRGRRVTLPLAELQRVA